LCNGLGLAKIYFVTSWVRLSLPPFLFAGAKPVRA
jgi:hypothetical protein